MKVAIHLIFVSFLLVLGGCSTNSSFIAKEQIKEFETMAKVCCKNLAQLPYKDIPLDQIIKEKLDQTAPAFQFRTGKSYFAAYKLPETVSYFINIRSDVVGIYAPSSYWLYPVVTLLDSNFNEVASYNAKLMLLENDNLYFDKYTTTLETTIKIDSPTKPPKYLIVHTDSKAFEYGVNFRTTSTPVYNIGSTVVAGGSENQELIVAFSPLGEIQVAILTKDDKPKGIIRRTASRSASIVKLPELKTE